MKETIGKELAFETRALFRKWLETEGATSEGVWLILAKNGATTTLSAQEALEEALCFGWIDGQMQSVDENSYRKYFARRREKSPWSEKNKELAKRLTEQGRMAPQGVNAITRARQNGQWNNSKRNTATEEQIRMFRQLVAPYEPAYTNLSAMPDSVQRTYTLFYLDAKTDKTRRTRLDKIIERLNKNLKPM